MYIGLWLVDGFPLLLVMVGILSHLCYGSLLSTFPVITLLSPGFIIGTRMWNYILLCPIYNSSMAIHAQSGSVYLCVIHFCGQTNLMFRARVFKDHTPCGTLVKAFVCYPRLKGSEPVVSPRIKNGKLSK